MAPALPDTISKPAWKTSSRPTSEEIIVTQYSHSYLWDKPEKHPGQTDPQPHKKTKLNNKQVTEKEHEAEGVGCCKLLPKIGQIMVHKDHLLSQ
jgi:hypothetical protein